MVSVLMCCFNSQNYLRFSIESILNQTFNEFEFIIIDDCSTDDSYNIILNYSELDKRIKVFRNNNNLGLTKSLNLGLSYCLYDLVFRMDADDVAIFNRLEIQSKYFYSKKLDILGGYSMELGYNKIRKMPLNLVGIKKSLVFKNPIIHPSVCYSKAKILSVGGYSEKYPKMQDYDLWFKAISSGFIIENMPEILIYYRVNSNIKIKNTFRYRLIESEIRFNGLRKLNLPIFYYFTILIPFFLLIIPKVFIDKFRNL
jgi:glycosyltransferase EpsE